MMTMMMKNDLILQWHQHHFSTSGIILQNAGKAQFRGQITFSILYEDFGS